MTSHLPSTVGLPGEFGTSFVSSADSAGAWLQSVAQLREDFYC